jgi:hypothetical protein
MEPKYALSQGNVKKKNTKKPGIFRKNRLQVAQFQGKRTAGIVEPCCGSSGKVALAVAATSGGLGLRSVI